MSRVIKCAVLHDEPKILENMRVHALTNQDETEADETPASLAATAAACAVMMKEQQEKMNKMLAEAEQQRNAAIADAQEESRRILEQTAIEAEQLRGAAQLEGKKSGYEDGYGEGIEAARQEMKAAIDEANRKAERTVAAAAADTKDCIVKAERKIVELAMAVVDKILPQHFIDVPQIVLPLVRAALEKVKDQRQIIVKVSPGDYELVLLAKNEFQMMIGSDEELTVVADTSINGGCIIETANGNVDARLETQTENLKKAILDVMS